MYAVTPIITNPQQSWKSRIIQVQSIAHFAIALGRGTGCTRRAD